jgi:hypothetical protein
VVCRACGYKRFGILPRIDGYGYGMVVVMVLVWLWNGCGYGFGCGRVLDRDDFWYIFVKMCDL